MRVIVTGLKYFSEQLVQDLSEFDRKNSYTFVNTYTSFWGKIKFMLLLPFTKVVISFNGPTDKSGSLDWVLRLRKKLLIQWMGTDAQHALQRQENKTINRKYIDYASAHLVDFDLLKEDVTRLGLTPEWQDFKSLKAYEPEKYYDDLMVLSYVPETRQAYYGMHWICELAAENPDTIFTLIGLQECEFETTPNMRFLGWTSEEETMELMKTHAVFLRLTEHDGCSLSVLKAMSMGAEVCWTFPYKYTHHTPGLETLKGRFTEVCELVQSRNLKPNAEIRNFVLESFQKEKVIRDYIRKIEEIAKK
ncbi:MAG: hypothetical protein K0R65_2159 [Crocinitomicaceae bacterium]|jgi:hypothetical protein|nr:hypothetical protein [Crocinitomicaceae bacterium]